MCLFKQQDSYSADARSKRRSTSDIFFLSWYCYNVLCNFSQTPAPQTAAAAASPSSPSVPAGTQQQPSPTALREPSKDSLGSSSGLDGSRGEFIRKDGTVKNSVKPASAFAFQNRAAVEAQAKEQEDDLARLRRERAQQFGGGGASSGVQKDLVRPPRRDRPVPKERTMNGGASPGGGEPGQSGVELQQQSQPSQSSSSPSSAAPAAPLQKKKLEASTAEADAAAELRAIRAKQFKQAKNDPEAQRRALENQQNLQRGMQGGGGGAPAQDDSWFGGWFGGSSSSSSGPPKPPTDS